MPEYEYVNEDIFTLNDFLSPEECQAYIEQAETIGFSEAPINTLGGPVVRSDVRNNSRVMLDTPDDALALWERLEVFVPKKVGDWEATGLNERLRFYRYDIGQQFDWHFDGCFQRNAHEQSLLTFMVYLNDGFEGGETSFDEDEIIPVQGTALCFVHQILHKGQPVRSGRKYALRTDVMYQRKG